MIRNVLISLSIFSVILALLFFGKQQQQPQQQSHENFSSVNMKSQIHDQVIQAIPSASLSSTTTPYLEQRFTTEENRLVSDNNTNPRSFIQTLQSIKKDHNSKLDKAIKRLVGFNDREEKRTKVVPRLFHSKSLMFGAVYIPVDLSSQEKRNTQQKNKNKKQQENDYQDIINSIAGPIDYDCLVQCRVMISSENNNNDVLSSKKLSHETYYKSCSDFLYHNSSSDSSSHQNSFQLLTFDVTSIAEYVRGEVFSSSSSSSSATSSNTSSMMTKLEVKVLVRKWMDHFDAVDDSIETITRILKKHSTIDFPAFEVVLDEKNIKNMISPAASNTDEVNDTDEDDVIDVDDDDSYLWISSSSSVKSSPMYQPPKGVGYAPWQNMDLTLFRPVGKQKKQRQHKPPKSASEKMNFWLKEFPALSVASSNNNNIYRKNTKFNTVFFGDSQPRTLYRHLQAVINKAYPVIHSKDFDIFSENDFAASRFVWDAYLTRFSNSTKRELFTEKLYLTIDAKKPMIKTGKVSSSTSNSMGEFISNLPNIIFFSIGPWPASFGQWSFEKYFDQLFELKKAIEELSREMNSVRMKNGGKQKIKFVNLGPLSWPKPRLTTGFRISNSRLRLFSKLNRKVLVSSSVNKKKKSKAFHQHYELLHANLWHWTHCVAKKYHRGDAMHYSSAVLFEILRNLMLEFG